MRRFRLNIALHDRLPDRLPACIIAAICAQIYSRLALGLEYQTFWGRSPHIYRQVSPCLGKCDLAGSCHADFQFAIFFHFKYTIVYRMSSDCIGFSFQRNLLDNERTRSIIVFLMIYEASQIGFRRCLIWGRPCIYFSSYVYVRNDCEGFPTCLLALIFDLRTRSLFYKLFACIYVIAACTGVCGPAQIYDIPADFGTCEFYASQLSRCSPDTHLVSVNLTSVVNRIALYRISIFTSPWAFPSLWKCWIQKCVNA